MPSIEVTGDIRLRKLRPTQGYRADDDDDDDYGDDSILNSRQWTKSSNPVIWTDTAEFYNVIYCGSEDISQHLSLIHTMSGSGSPSALHVKKTVPPNVTSTSWGSSVIFGFSVKRISHKTQVQI